MKVISKGVKYDIEVDGDSQKEVWRKLASAEEIFCESRCGACKGTDIRHAVREGSRTKGKKVETFEFFELHCKNPKCRARKRYGILQKDGESLFPHRKDENSNWLPNDGWIKPPKESEDATEGGGDDKSTMDF